MTGAGNLSLPLLQGEPFYLREAFAQIAHRMYSPPALFGKRKKMLAFIANVKDVRGRTKLSVIFFSYGTQENDIANIMWEQYRNRVDSEWL